MKSNAKSNPDVKKDVEENEDVPLDRDSIKDAIFEIAVDMFALGESDGEDFEEMELENDAKCDVLDIVEFIMSLEDRFGVIVEEDESDKLVTFGDCVDLIWGKVAAENME